MESSTVQEPGGGLQHLSAVCLLECAAFAGLTDHTVWATRHYGDGRPDVLEVFGGHAQISLRAAGHGWLALQPFDMLYGQDLLGPSQLKEL